MSERKRPIYVIGHKNPDTDSICSAICYAKLKGKIDSTEQYLPARAGNLNEETQYVLDRFKVKVPRFIQDMGTQVRDIEIRETKGVTKELSMKKAWELMKDQQIVTLPITNIDNELLGLITIDDIARSYMGVYDNSVLSAAKTTFANIVETLEGEMIEGDMKSSFTKGKVLIAAATPELIEEQIEEGDLVILGNRYESQLSAIESGAGVLIITDGAKVSKSIITQAKAHNATIISTPHDTYTVARLMNQSLSIRFFMTTDDLDTFCTDDFIDNIKDVMATKRHRDFPIIDRAGKYVGFISRRNLMNSARKRVILVDHNEKDQAVEGIEESEILEIIDHHRLRSVETFSPVFFRNQPLGCTATIIYKMYKENKVEIDYETAGLLLSAILSDTLMFRSPTSTNEDKDAADELARIANIDVEELAAAMFNAGSNLKDKKVEDLFYQDFKRFTFNDVDFGVGQINCMSMEELSDLKVRMIPFMQKELAGSGLQMMFFMLTNILKESTELLFVGSGAKELIEEAMNTESVVDAEGNESFLLRKVVSRKKQMIPQIMVALQN